MTHLSPTEQAAIALYRRQQQQQVNLLAVMRQAQQTQQLTKQAVAAFAGLFLTTDTGIPITPAEHHWLWLHFLCDDRVKRLLLLAPPEAAKTTWAISGFVGAYITVHPERSVIIGSASGPIAEKRSQSLRLVTQSDMYQAAFPNILPARGMTWSATEWSLAPGGIPHAGRLHPTVSAFGTGGPVIGARADIVIADDLLDFENSRTAHQRGLVEQWMHRSLLSRRKAKTGRAIVIGTAWHHDDLYARLAKQGDWIVIRLQLLSDSPSVYATIIYPDSWLFERVGEPVAQATLGTHTPQLL